MLREMGPFPEFYFQPAPRRGDHDWIEGRLRRLNTVNRELVCQQYREIYLRRGREAANNHLLEFVKEYGYSREEFEKVKEEASTPKELQARIEQLKAAQKKARPRIDLGDL